MWCLLIFHPKMLAIHLCRGKNVRVLKMVHIALWKMCTVERIAVEHARVRPKCETVSPLDKWLHLCKNIPKQLLNRCHVETHNNKTAYKHTSLVASERILLVLLIKCEIIDMLENGAVESASWWI